MGLAHLFAVHLEEVLQRRMDGFNTQLSEPSLDKALGDVFHVASVRGLRRMLRNIDLQPNLLADGPTVTCCRC